MIRQPASENSFTVACPMPREAPVNTIVFCPADGRGAISEGRPGKGQSTVFSSAGPPRIVVRAQHSAHRYPRQGCTIRIAQHCLALTSMGFARSGPTRVYRILDGPEAGSHKLPAVLMYRCGRMSNFQHIRHVRYKLRCHVATGTTVDQARYEPALRARQSDHVY